MSANQIENSKFVKINATYSLPISKCGSIEILDEEALDRILAAPYEIEKNKRSRPSISPEGLSRIRVVLNEMVRMAVAASLTGFLLKEELEDLQKKARKADRLTEWMSSYVEDLQFNFEWQHCPNHSDRDYHEGFSAIRAAIKNDRQLLKRQANLLLTGAKSLEALHTASSKFASLVFPPPIGSITDCNFGARLVEFLNWIEYELSAYEAAERNPRGPKPKHYLRQLYRELSGLLAVIEQRPRETTQALIDGENEWPRIRRDHNLLELRNFGSPLKRMIYQTHREVFAKIATLKLSPKPEPMKLRSLWTTPTDSDLDKTIPTWINTVFRDGRPLPLREGHAEVVSLRLGLLG
ncbi:hypothetical protein ACFQ14_00835 [Pseudahrensia aquimaris]|uniref:Uncharacterized protein n=1 Tax=Pseudahrensia aquimaris TaxID=744461 RepID=A0ABW3FD96_9HYPH